MLIHRHKVGVAKKTPTVVKTEKTVEKPVEKPIEKSGVTKEEIEKMPYFGLKSLAEKHEIDVEGMKSADIKAALIKKLGL